MAEASPNNQDLFTCPICLDLLKDPVTIPCGHSYCMGCIKGCWVQEDQKGVYSCPQCRQTFTPRPVLSKNNIFAELVDQMRKARIQTAVPAHSGHGDVECDVCTGRKLKAVKSCLDCLLSYCETHYEAHNKLTGNPRRKHKVVDATGQLQERICSQHEKPLEIFCRTDQSCVCFLCMVDEHKGHDTVSASAERKEKQTQLAEKQRRFQQRIQEREKELQEMRKTVENLKSSAQTAVEDSERIFTEMIRSIERRRSEVTELIRAQEKAEVSWAEGHLKRLEQEIAELKRRDAELEELSHTDDHIHFLKTFQSVSDLPESKDSINVNQSLSFEAVRKSVSTLKEQLENLWKQEVINTSGAVMKVQTILPSAPSTRKEFLRYACKLTLDPNTAHRNLSLSEGNRKVTWVDEEQPYPDHPERFDSRLQVLCRKGLSGRCYWEAEWSGDGACIAVAYKSIKRKEDSYGVIMGYNAKSWSLFCSPHSYSARHNNKHTAIPAPSSGSRRVGVYLDWPAGTLSFYRVSSDTLTHLHTFHSTFTEPLYPGFRLDWWKSSGSLCQIP